jgi:hypothetical protein
MPPSSEALIYSLAAAKSITNDQPNLLYGKELVAISGDGTGGGKKIDATGLEFFEDSHSLIFGFRRHIIGP